MAVQVELWRENIQGKLFDQNPFLDKCVRVDEYVYRGKIVHLPQAGAVVGVQRNRTVYPLPSSRRVDTDVVYTLNEYSTGKFVVADLDTKQLSYSKRDSIIEDNAGNLFDTAAQNVLYDWTAVTPVATNMLNVTGAVGASTDPTKRRFLPADIERAAKMLDDQLVPSMDRYILLTNAMYYDLMTDATMKGYFQQIVNMKSGELPDYMGFKLLRRATTVRLNAAGVLLLPETAPTAADVPGAIFWQKNAFESALGDMKVFELLGDPDEQGDTYSMLINTGGRARRADNVGYGIIRHIP